jgi:hypothetical protein
MAMQRSAIILLRHDAVFGQRPAGADVVDYHQVLAFHRAHEPVPGAVDRRAFEREALGQRHGLLGGDDRCRRQHGLLGAGRG